jgi:excisionase family DNA binding protein
MQDRGTGRAGLLTAAQVEERLGVDVSTVYRMAADGRLPAVKVGRQWRFASDGVDAIVAGTGGRSARTALDPDGTQAVIDVSASMLGVMMLVTDMDGHPVSQVANPCPWFAQRANDPGVVAACVEEWRVLADDLDVMPRFRTGRLGFDCARAFIRAGSELVGMVLVGGVAPDPQPDDGLYHLDDHAREQALDALPKVAAALSTAVRTPTTRRSA